MDELAERTGPEAGAEVTLEGALERLHEIVDRMEGEPLELDESLALFEEGVRLLRSAGAVLDGAEERVRALLDGDGGGFRLEPLALEP
jgi:exodeoxyribonuclease VII small subunit